MSRISSERAVIILCANIAKSEASPDKLRVLVIFGSPRMQGKTARLLEAFLNNLTENAVIDRYDCFERSPLPCNDCRACHEINRCALSDLDDFYNKLEAAQVLVFATPIYNLSFPAPMKALIDRMQRYWAARFIRNIRPPIKLSKRAILITTCGSDNTEGAEILERQLKPVLTIINARLIKSLHYTGADKNLPLGSSSITQAKDAARLI